MNRLRLFSVIALFFACIAWLSAQDQQAMRITRGWEFYRGELGSVWEALRNGRPAELPVWKQVSLPHSYNALDAVDPDVAYYEGPGWYRTKMEVENPHNRGRTLLHFEGAGQKTSVYVYDHLVGEHVGGYDEFTIDLTDAIESFRDLDAAKAFDGRIPVSIRVDNSRDVEMIPSDLSDFNVYGGLYRYVNLVYVPGISIGQVHLTPVLSPDYQSCSVQAAIRLYNPERKEKDLYIDMTILSSGGEEVYTDTRRIHTRTATSNVIFNLDQPELWSPDSPGLYTAIFSYTTTYGSGSKTERFGIREFDFLRQGPFKLNGERLLLKGTHRHEDHAGVGPAMTEEMIRQEIRMMKEMGVNFLRLGHYQQSRIVLDACDELGILVWEEIPWCRGGLGGEAYKSQARRMLKNMITQHYNHPSVIIWGLGNENDWPGDFDTFEEEKIRAFMSELNEISHKVDPSRKTAIRRCDFCKDIVDVYSPSIWAGWYRGKYTDYMDVSRTNMEQVDHFLHVEWGASHHAGRHSENPDMGLENISSSDQADERDGDFLMKGGEPRVSRDGDWTESYAVNLIDWHLKEQEKMDWLTGTAYWPFKDFSTPLRPDNPVPYVNQKGVLERDFTKKESYYVFQSYWTDKPMVHIYGHSWSTRWGREKGGNMVKVYSNCPSAELFLNGKSQGIRARVSQNFPAAGLRWIVKFKEGENFLRVTVEKGGEKVEDRITVNFQTREWASPARFVFEETDRQGDTAILRVMALDDQGVLCLDATEFVRFGLTGDGSLIDNLGTSNGSRKIQLMNGRAQIRVKLNGGYSVASVSSGAVPTEFCVLTHNPKPSVQEIAAIPTLESSLTGKVVMNDMTRVCEWQLAHMPQPGEHPRHYRHWDWTNAVLYTGVLAHYRASGNKKYVRTLEGFVESIDWTCGPRFRHSDDLCIGQTYLELNELKAGSHKIIKLQARVDSLMSDSKPGRMDWWWCDALYMAPPMLARLAIGTGESRYLDYMNEMWWDATEFLYDPEENLYYRDDRFRIKADGSGRREVNGEKVFWSRGNGWVLAGISRVLDYMPEDYPDREKYIDLYKEMVTKIVSLQGRDGLWRASLLHPEGHPHGETSGSGFYCYALAWGINQGILDRETYMLPVLRAWNGLIKAVQPEGKLGWVQQIGTAPAEIHKDMTEVYGVGAFLLAGSEMVKLL
ncbi:MAG: glycoside hydrolase family 88 protein [Bacteroidales bacterium]|nr:glycoside hydrolase family 88 protein [Bacteroidales bacterium]